MKELASISPAAAQLIISSDICKTSATLLLQHSGTVDGGSCTSGNVAQREESVTQQLEGGDCSTANGHKSLFEAEHAEQTHDAHVAMSDDALQALLQLVEVMPHCICTFQTQTACKKGHIAHLGAWCKTDPVAMAKVSIIVL